jgi:hypothetical protein
MSVTMLPDAATVKQLPSIDDSLLVEHGAIFNSLLMSVRGRASGCASAL